MGLTCKHNNYIFYLWKLEMDIFVLMNFLYIFFNLKSYTKCIGGDKLFLFFFNDF